MPYEIDKKYNCLDRISKWDSETKKVIKQRIANELGDVLSYQFLTEQEGEILELLVDTLIPQKEVYPLESRKADAPQRQFERIEISKTIDQNLTKNMRGVRYGANPWPREFYQKGLADFAAQAKEIFGKPIEDFSAEQTEKYVSDIFSRDPDDFLRRFARRVLSDATAIYFSHPDSWNMIGFPGPAFPEGYPFLGCDEKEDWEPNYRKR